MQKIYWLPDKEKDGELFTNSVCFTYCLKHFIIEHRLELWDKRNGFEKTFRTEAGAWFEFHHIKNLSYQEIIGYVFTNFEQK